MGRVLKTSSGSASGTGLSTSDVNALIEAKSKWEFIKKIEINTSVNSLELSDGIDSTKYNSYLYEFEDLRPSSGQLPYWRIKNLMELITMLLHLITDIQLATHIQQQVIKHSFILMAATNFQQLIE